MPDYHFFSDAPGLMESGESPWNHWSFGKIPRPIVGLPKSASNMSLLDFSGLLH